MNQRPDCCFVSVVIPCYNRLELLKTTARTLLAQRETRCEFIFVDDQSEGETWRFLQSLTADARVRLLRKPAGAARGCQSSRNLGLDAAVGNYVMFLDSDDLLEPDCLRHRAQFAVQNPKADIVVGNQAILFEQHGNAAWVNQEKNQAEDLDRFLHLAAPVDVPWVNAGCIIKTSRLRDVGVRWRTEYLWDDAMFHIDCLLGGLKSAWMPRAASPDSWYRLHGTTQFGNSLHAPAGRRNISEMILFLARRLSETGLWTGDRELCLFRALFVRCILPEIDDQTAASARKQLAQIEECGLFARSPIGMVQIYSRLRRIVSRSTRFTFLLNRVFRRILRDCFDGAKTESYATVPVDPSAVQAMLAAQH